MKYAKISVGTVKLKKDLLKLDNSVQSKAAGLLGCGNYDHTCDFLSVNHPAFFFISLENRSWANKISGQSFADKVAYNFWLVLWFKVGQRWHYGHGDLSPYEKWSKTGLARPVFHYTKS
jgi:hypothetical protein